MIFRHSEADDRWRPRCTNCTPHGVTQRTTRLWRKSARLSGEKRRLYCTPTHNQPLLELFIPTVPNTEIDFRLGGSPQLHLAGELRGFPRRVGTAPLLNLSVKQPFEPLSNVHSARTSFRSRVPALPFW